jgi:hypothetical protein
MQALKLGFARRVLIQMRRRHNAAHPNSSSALRSTSGRSASTTAMSGRNANALRSYATCTATQ